MDKFVCWPGDENSILIIFGICVPLDETSCVDVWQIGDFRDGSVLQFGQWLMWNVKVKTKAKQNTFPCANSTENLLVNTPFLGQFSCQPMCLEQITYWYGFDQNITALKSQNKLIRGPGGSVRHRPLCRSHPTRPYNRHRKSYQKFVKT